MVCASWPCRDAEGVVPGFARRASESADRPAGRFRGCPAFCDVIGSQAIDNFPPRERMSLLGTCSQRPRSMRKTRKSFRSDSYEKCVCKSFRAHSYKISALKVSCFHILPKKRWGYPLRRQPPTERNSRSVFCSPKQGGICCFSFLACVRWCLLAGHPAAICYALAALARQSREVALSNEFHLR